MSKLPQQDATNIIVGFDHSDDAGVFRLSDDVALVQTLDFFTPVADDPATYGRIAATNALNDVYAMGGTPLSALSIVCYPQKGDMDVLGEILAGGQAAMNEHGVVVIGGHSVDDQEIKIGYSVTGTIHPDKVITNGGAQPGDSIILTKPIGTGAINTAVKRGVASESTVAAAIRTMSASSAPASQAMVRHSATACTDVTGFGLLGHAFELAKASDVTLEIDSSQVPLLPDVLKLIEMGMLTRGDKNNRVYVGDTVAINDSVGPIMQSVLFDPQTAGGLLITLSVDHAESFLREVVGAVKIGSVVDRGQQLIIVS